MDTPGRDTAPRWLARVVWVAMVISASGCSDAIPSTPGVAGSPALPVQPGSLWKVAGTVWVHGPAGVTQASDGTVDGWVEFGTRGSAIAHIPIDQNGRYSFDVPAGASRVHVTGPRHQPCATSLPISGDVTADVHVVRDPLLLGARLPAALLARQPTLSGVVYEMTSEGRRPLSNAWVTLDALWGLGLMVADTRTDDDGRYVLCNVPAIHSLAVVVGLTGFEIYEVAVPPGGPTTLDIEMRRVPGADRARGR